MTRTPPISGPRRAPRWVLPHKSIFAGEVQVDERTILGNQHNKWPVFRDFLPGRPVRLHRARRGTVRLLFINQIMEYIVR